jgi:hypothetical protein
MEKEHSILRPRTSMESLNKVSQEENTEHCQESGNKKSLTE